MLLSINRDYFNNPVPPQVFLCTQSGKIINELPAASVKLVAKWNSYSELSFEVPRTYVDMLTGERKIHPTYDKIDSPRQVYVSDIGFFILQDIDDIADGGDTKSVTAFSAEYAVAGKYLNSFYVNTGEIGSVEVTYNETTYGLDYSSDRDSFYKIADEYGSYESYYHKVYSDSDSYEYEQIQIVNKEEYDSWPRSSDELYMKRIPNVQFYNPNRKGLSLLHLILENNVPEWKIGNVDQSLWLKERTFSQDRISVYDFLMNDVADTFKCVFVWDTITKTVHVYAEAEDGVEENGEIQTQWATDVFISRENLASEIQVKYSADGLKTKLVVTGSDDLDIREVNLGRNEIMDLSYYHTEDWMEQDLYEAYDDYLDALDEASTGIDISGQKSKRYPMAYSDAMQGWVGAYNKWNDLMNMVPAEGNVVLVGDEFKKLYCTYSPIDNAYYGYKDEESGLIVAGTIQENMEISPSNLYTDAEFTTAIKTPSDNTTYVVQNYTLVYSQSKGYFEVGANVAVTENKLELFNQLNLYHVDEDTAANVNDNILLKIKNSASDVATIRVYDARRAVTNGDVYSSKVKYYTLDDEGVYADVTSSISNENFLDKKATLHTNDYKIQSLVVRASSGTPEAAKTYSATEWLSGELTAEKMGFIKYGTGGNPVRDNKGNTIPDYTVTYIGTMGAYFVLAKDERHTENLQDYGIKMLEEKHKTYTKIFQTQTEAMYSQDKYQCIVQDDMPDGNYSNGTKWLDTNSHPAILYEYSETSQSWVVLSGPENQVTAEDKYKYENYQRYIDNYKKLIAVQEVLSEKEKKAEYCLNGYPVYNDEGVPMSVDLFGGDSVVTQMQLIAERHVHSYYPIYIKDENGNYSYDDDGNPQKADDQHTISLGQLVWGNEIDKDLAWYTFTTSADVEYEKNTKEFDSATQYYTYNSDTKTYSYDANVTASNFSTYDELYVLKSTVYAVYFKNDVPYVAYENSQGMYDMMMKYIREKTEANNFFTKDQWVRLSPFIKEDEYNDSNFLLTGYESEEERLSICKELMESAAKELKTLCQPSLEFSMTMANILALPEFDPLFDQFQLGNFIRVGIREDYVKRSRLLEVSMSFDDLGDFSATFGNLVTTKSEVDKHAALLAQAVSAGKQVAKSSGSWQKSVDKTNWIEDRLANGLSDLTLSVGSASGQAISWDSTGMHFRKYRDGSSTEFEPEEMAIINNALVATNDSWKTAKAAFGKYKIGDEEHWGPIAEYMTADTLEGKLIRGGAIEIGSGDTKFIVNEDGSVEIRSGGTNYVNAMTEINNAYSFSTALTYNGLTIFSDTSHECTVTCEVYHYKDLITSDIVENGGTFTWKRTSNYPTDDATWKPTYVDGKPNVIKVKVGDIIKNSQIYCEVNFDEKKFTNDNEET